jgi:hypothetical protein
MMMTLPVVAEEDLKHFVPAITSDEVGEMMKPKRGRPAKDKQ